jgi:ribosomal-protein-alanine N-acetyltransferase
MTSASPVICVTDFRTRTLKKTLADWLDRVSNDSKVTRFAIDVNGILAGGIGIQPLTGEHTGVADFGYWLGYDFWGRGIATSAARALVPYAFETLGTRRLEAPIMAANVASGRVLEKAGFLRECTLVDWYMDRDGNVHDGIMYRLNRSECLQTAPQARAP